MVIINGTRDARSTEYPDARLNGYPQVRTLGFSRSVRAAMVEVLCVDAVAQQSKTTSSKTLIGLVAGAIRSVNEGD